MRSNAINKILEEVLEKIKPSREEREKILSLAEKLCSDLKKELGRANLKAEVRVEGSVAKDTWLSENPDIDIFVRFPPVFQRKNLEQNFCK